MKHADVVVRSQPEGPATRLLDKLIGLWGLWETQRAYYIEGLVPNIVRMDGSVNLTREERALVEQLHAILAPDEWRQLPQLFEARLDGDSTEIRADTEWREKKRKEEEQRRKRLEREAAAKEEEGRRKSEERRRKERLNGRIQECLRSQFLGVDEVFADHVKRGEISLKVYERLKAEFVRDWASENLPWKLDLKQAAAVADTHGDVLVTARAGSGKTRTLVSKAIFIQAHCHVPPSALLVLAFNRQAVDEIKSRMADVLGDQLPHVMTFHSLAYSIVHPSENLVYDNVDADQLGQSREIQEIIDEHLIDPEFADRTRKVMLAHFREDWERIVRGGFELTMPELLEYRRSLPRESLNGEFVKSFGEKLIANVLLEHGVNYKYEWNHTWNDASHRPDFTIFIGKGKGVVIEYFGLEGDSDYDEMRDEKRRFWSRREEWTLLEVAPDEIAQLGEEGFAQHLLSELRKLGIESARRSEEQIWEEIRHRAVDRFSTAMSSFIGRARKANHSVNKLQWSIERHKPASTAEELFLQVALSVYSDYLDRLTDKRMEDFDGLVWRAGSHVASGKTRFVRDRGRERGNLADLRFILIDEFQDFSEMFFNSVDAVRSKNPRAKLFCVGDDWQAINGFAGSDLRYFNQFADLFPGASSHYMGTNYRSVEKVVEVANVLMHGLGPRATAADNAAGRVRLGRLDEFRPSAAEETRHERDAITPAVLRMIGELLGAGQDVVILSRRNHVPWQFHLADGSWSGSLKNFLEHIGSFLTEDQRRRVSVSTVHRYKGLESRAVIVLDAIRGSYPLIHPNWVFTRVFGDNIKDLEDEERRLFYVALSRAKASLVILTSKADQSPFVDDILSRTRVETINWNEQEPVSDDSRALLEIRVFGAYHVRGSLKELGYRFKMAGKFWYRTAPEDGFSRESLLAEPWVQGVERIEVRSESGGILCSYP